MEPHGHRDSRIQMSAAHAHGQKDNQAKNGTYDNRMTVRDKNDKNEQEGREVLGEIGKGGDTHSTSSVPFFTTGVLVSEPLAFFLRSSPLVCYR